jgi:hypothetical protein
MRLKSELYKKEQEEIVDKIIGILEFLQIVMFSYKMGVLNEKRCNKNL